MILYKLYELEYEAFISLSSLVELTMDFNSINIIKSITLNQLINLINLSISNNEIEMIENFSFYKLKYLEHIILDNYKINR